MGCIGVEVFILHSFRTMINTAFYFVLCKLISICLCLGFDVCLGVGQCKHTINAALSLFHIYRFSTVFVSGTFDMLTLCVNSTIEIHLVHFKS